MCLQGTSTLQKKKQHSVSSCNFLLQGKGVPLWGLSKKSHPRTPRRKKKMAGRLTRLARKAEELARDIHETAYKQHLSPSKEESIANQATPEALLPENVGIIFVGIASAFIVVTLIGGVMMLRNSPGGFFNFNRCINSIN